MNVVYHASPEKNLDLIKPRSTLSHNHYIGDYVFATAEQTLSTMYLATKGVLSLMNPAAESPWIVLCSKPAA